MPLKTLTLLFVACAVLTSCATPYQSELGHNDGGYSQKRITENVFAVSFSGNGFTTPGVVAEYVKLRSAEVTLEHGFKYFTIIADEDQTSMDTVRTSATSYTTGTVNQFGSYNAVTTTSPSEVNIIKPASELTIRCFDARPGGHSGIVYDAKQVTTEQKAKLKIAD